MYLHLHPPRKALELPGAPDVSRELLQRFPGALGSSREFLLSPGSSWELSGGQLVTFSRRLPGPPEISRELLGAPGRLLEVFIALLGR